MATNASTSLPMLTVRDGTTFTVDAGDPGAVITQLVVHGWQEDPSPPAPIPLDPVLAHLPDQAP